MHALNGKEIVVASHNAGKLYEFAGLIVPFGFTAKSAKDYGLPEPDETGTTFEENAYIKAYAAAKATGLPANRVWQAWMPPSGGILLSISNTSGV